MIVLAVLALAVVSSSALPRPDGVAHRADDAGISNGQLERLEHASPAAVTTQDVSRRGFAQTNEGSQRARPLNALGNGNLLLQPPNDVNERAGKLDTPVGGGNQLRRPSEGRQRTRQLDTLGNGNLLRRASEDLEPQSGDEMAYGRTRQLDTLGGGWLLLKEEPFRNALVSVSGHLMDDPDETPLYYLGKPGELESLYDRLYNRRLIRNMNLDPLDGSTFGASKRFDSLNGIGFGAQKRNFDEIDHVGFNSFVKKNFEDNDRLNGFVKRPMDEIDRVGFNGFVKRPMDEIDRVGFNSFVKRPMDEIDRVGFNGFVKRH